MQGESLEILEKANLPSDQARAIVRAIEIEIDSAEDKLATKHDVLLLRQDMTDMRHGLELRIEALGGGVNTKLEIFRGDLEAKIEERTGHLETRLEQFRGTLETQAEAHRGKLESKIDVRCGKLETQAERVRGHLEAKIDERCGKLETRLEQFGGALESKLEATMRNHLRHMYTALIAMMGLTLTGVYFLITHAGR